MLIIVCSVSWKKNAVTPYEAISFCILFHAISDDNDWMYIFAVLMKKKQLIIISHLEICKIPNLVFVFLKHKMTDRFFSPFVRMWIVFIWWSFCSRLKKTKKETCGSSLSFMFLWLGEAKSVTSSPTFTYIARTEVKKIARINYNSQP